MSRVFAHVISYASYPQVLPVLPLHKFLGCGQFPGHMIRTIAKSWLECYYKSMGRFMGKTDTMERQNICPLFRWVQWGLFQSDFAKTDSAFTRFLAPFAPWIHQLIKHEMLPISGTGHIHMCEAQANNIAATCESCHKVQTVPREGN
jgi:hypothetical protein